MRYLCVYNRRYDTAFLLLIKNHGTVAPQRRKFRRSCFSKDRYRSLCLCSFALSAQSSPNLLPYSQSSRNFFLILQETAARSEPGGQGDKTAGPGANPADPSRWCQGGGHQFSGSEEQTITQVNVQD